MSMRVTEIAMGLTDYLLVFAHILPWALAMGAAYYFAFVALPMANNHLEGEKKIEFLRRNIRYYSPFFLLMLSIVVVAGAIRLTDYKSMFDKSEYMGKVAYPLIAKLVLFLIVYILAAYQSFALGLRVTGIGEKAMGDKVEEKLIESVANKMHTIAILNLIFMSAAALVGILFSRISYDSIRALTNH